MCAQFAMLTKNSACCLFNSSFVDNFTYIIIYVCIYVFVFIFKSIIC